MNKTAVQTQTLNAGMVGMGMIFEETYRPVFEHLHKKGLYDHTFGFVQVPLSATASRTGSRARRYLEKAGNRIAPFHCFSEPDSLNQLLNSDVDFVCVATPDDRHFEAARKVLSAGKHLFVEKPSVLTLQQLDELTTLADQKQVLAKVVYHKLLDPDHKKLRTLVAAETLQHINTGYCSLLEPKQISGEQFSEWIKGRNPGTYVAVHYIKLIDFTFGGKLKTVMATGQKGLVGDPDGKTWDSVQLRLIYQYEDAREAAFDIHTSWVTPDNFAGYVEQEVQFRFDNGLWNGHSRKRGVELTVEDQTPMELKSTINNHYNGTFLEPWGEKSQRGYGLEVIEQFIREVATVEFAGPQSERAERVARITQFDYNDIRSDRQTVAAVQAMEAILEKSSQGTPDAIVYINHDLGGLALFTPGSNEPEILYSPHV